VIRAQVREESNRAVNVNIHHINDLVDQDLASAVELLARRLDADRANAVVKAVRAVEAVSRGRDHFAASGYALGGLLQSFLADLAIETGAIEFDQNGLRQPTFQDSLAPRLVEFGDWIAATVHSGAISYMPKPDQFSVTDIPDDASIALFGDWAAGTRESEAVASSIAASRCTATVHLGDVYYSGTRRETEQFLLEPWPCTTRAIGRACNSNHEMFSGGRTYWERSLPALGQYSAHFALRTRHWLLVGLDTGTRDGALGVGQLRELRRLVDREDNRRVILLSHHPLYDTVAGPSADLLSEVRPLLANGKVAAWYWAHEHACLSFKEESRFCDARLRCVGHGGFPYLAYPASRQADSERAQSFAEPLALALGVPAAQVLCGQGSFTADGAAYGPHGWLRLDLDGPRATESLLGADGTVCYSDVY
jgi:hypothetical protein